mmetsp:Transcript_17542/g.27324  ORF Transcript_17542/g.27324 Transcript_17542/m.27324 type:complete len:103 (+) Transcript_17542:436-744(+)
MDNAPPRGAQKIWYYVGRVKHGVAVILRDEQRFFSGEEALARDLSQANFPTVITSSIVGLMTAYQYDAAEILDGIFVATSMLLWKGCDYACCVRAQRIDRAH